MEDPFIAKQFELSIKSGHEKKEEKNVIYCFTFQEKSDHENTDRKNLCMNGIICEDNRVIYCEEHQMKREIDHGKQNLASF